MRKKDFLVFEGKDKKERIAKATEVSKIISNLVMPTRDTRMKNFRVEMQILLTKKGF